MNFKQAYPTMNIHKYTRIGNIIPKESITLVTGLPACGKSFTTLKFLNQEKIKPFVFNLDEDPNLLQFKCCGMTSDTEALKLLFSGEDVGIDNEVIVINTYIQMVNKLGLENTQADQKYIVETLEKLCKDRKYTIIVIGHPEDYVGKSSIFKDNPLLVRNCHEHIHFDKIMPTGKNAHNISYITYINKNRGNGGTYVLEDWLR